MTTPAARIVVGVDGSAASVAALRWAINQAQLTGAEVQAVTSWQTPGQYGFEFYTVQVDWPDVARRTLANSIKEAGDGSHLNVSSVVLQGHPAYVLVEVSLGAQLLVVGSRGHGGFAGMLLGSVSEYAVAHASCPVLVVRDQPTLPAAAGSAGAP